MTAEELNQLANDVIQSKVFMTNTKDGVEYSFGMLLMFMDEAARAKLEEADPACFYAPYSEAGPRSVNGYPQFLSMAWLSQEEWEVFYPLLEEKRKVLGIPADL